MGPTKGAVTKLKKGLVVLTGLKEEGSFVVGGNR